MQIERRTFQAEIRTDGAGRKIRGTAIVFDQLSENLGGYRERISPGALEGCDMTDVRCLVNHDENRILGRTVSKTLQLEKSAGGLGFTCEPPDTTYARDLAASMDRGDIDKCSFSFVVAPGGAEWSEEPATGGEVRTVNKIARLFDVSVVTYPAYTQTSSEIRTHADILSERQAPAAVDIDLLRRGMDLELYARQ